MKLGDERAWKGDRGDCVRGMYIFRGAGLGEVMDCKGVLRMGVMERGGVLPSLHFCLFLIKGKTRRGNEGR